MAEVKQLQLSDWKIKTIRSSAEDEGYNSWREKVKYRVVEVAPNMRVEEGVILEHEERPRGSKEPYTKEYNQHLVGYHYVCLINGKNEDVFWFQRHGGDDVYRFFYDAEMRKATVFANAQDAWKEFNRVLKEKYGVKIDYKTAVCDN